MKTKLISLGIVLFILITSYYIGEYLDKKYFHYFNSNLKFFSRMASGIMFYFALGILCLCWYAIYNLLNEIK